MSLAEPLRAVTFDFWGTLARDTPDGLARARTARLAALADIVRRAGVAEAAAAVETAYERCGREMQARFWTTERDCSIERQVAIFLDCVAPGLAGRLATEALESAVDAYVTPILRWPPALLPGAEQAVRALAARGLALGVISNTGRTPGIMLRRLLERFGLLRHFRVVSYSDELGVSKPARAIFDLTVRALDTPPARALHVGDNAVDDVRGARAAGLRAAHYAPEGRPPSADADLVVCDLGELPGRLERWLG